MLNKICVFIHLISYLILFIICIIFLVNKDLVIISQESDIIFPVLLFVLFFCSPFRLLLLLVKKEREEHFEELMDEMVKILCVICVTFIMYKRNKFYSTNRRKKKNIYSI